MCIYVLFIRLNLFPLGIQVGANRWFPKALQLGRIKGFLGEEIDQPPEKNVLYWNLLLSFYPQTKVIFLSFNDTHVELLNVIHTLECSWCLQSLRTSDVWTGATWSLWVSKRWIFDQRNLKMKLWKEDGTKLQTLQNHHLERSQILSLNPGKLFLAKFPQVITSFSYLWRLEIEISTSIFLHSITPPTLLPASRPVLLRALPIQRSKA